MKDSVLVGTFVNNKKLPGRSAREIAEFFNIGKMFAFEVEEEGKKRYLITFNIPKEDKEGRLREFKERYKNTVQLHRNRDYNTLYTINSLNKVVEDQNGQRDENFEVDWSDFKNSCLLLGKDGELKILKTKIHDIYEL